MENRSEDFWDHHRQSYPAVGKNVYLASAAVSPIHRKVFEAGQAHLRLLYEMGDLRWQDGLIKIDECRTRAADILGAQSDDIAFFPNTSTAMTAFAKLTLESSGSSRDPGEVLTLRDEFPASVIPWAHAMKNSGWSLRLLEITQDAKTSLVDQILKSIGSKTRVLVMSHVQFASGERSDLVRLGSELEKRGILFFVNATQSFGVFPIDVRESKVTALAASCHKWVGAGYGISVGYLHRSFISGKKWPWVGWTSVQDPMGMDPTAAHLIDQPRALESGVLPITGFFCLAEALAVIQELGVSAISSRVVKLMKKLVAEAQRKQLTIMSPWAQPLDQNEIIDDQRIGGILLLAPPYGKSADETVRQLGERGVIVTARRGGVRVSLHAYNHEKDIEKFIAEFER